MPWNKDSSLQLQDMYDQVYSHLIRTSKHRDTTLRTLGQVIISQGMAPDVDTLGSRQNSSSPVFIAAILGIEHGSVMRIATEMHSLLEVGSRDEDIRIRYPAFIDFLLDRTRSQELFINIDEARLVLRDAPTIIRGIFNNEGM